MGRKKGREAGRKEKEGERLILLRRMEDCWEVQQKGFLPKNMAPGNLSYIHDYLGMSTGGPFRFWQDDV